MKPVHTYILIGGIALVVGAAGGFLAKQILGQEKTVYIGDVNSLEVDAKEIKQRYDNYSGSTPEKDFTAAELINIGLESYRQCEYSFSYGIGTAKTIVQQTIRNAQIRNKNNYFEESISESGIVHVANRMTQTGVDGDISLYNGKSTSSETADYGSEPVVRTAQDYKAYLGRTLSEMFIYTISDATVLTKEVSKLDSGEYQIKVSLDPDRSTYHYKYQMKNISNLDALPSFDYVNLTFTFTSNMMLKHLKVDEGYKATMGFTVSINNEIEYYYFPNQEMAIPDLSTNINYSWIGGN